jgi:hypothetical protein
MEAAKGEDWLALEQDTIIVDVDRLLLRDGLRAHTNLTRITCEDGALVVESGT